MQTLLCDCVTHCELLHDPGGDLAPSFTVFRSFVSPPTLNNFMSILTGSIPRWVCEQNKLCCIIVPNGQLIATRSLTTNLFGPHQVMKTKKMTGIFIFRVASMLTSPLPSWLSRRHGSGIVIPSAPHCLFKLCQKLQESSYDYHQHHGTKCACASVLFQELLVTLLCRGMCILTDLMCETVFAL